MKKSRTPIIGVMGPGSNATKEEIALAEHLGGLIAENQWRILTGGMNTGVMNAALKGAKTRDSNCVTIGILPHRGESELTSKYVDIPIPTGMGEGRNNLNVLTADYVVVCCNSLGSSPGTDSEFTFAIKHKKPLLCLYSKNYNLEDDFDEEYQARFRFLSEELRHNRQICITDPGNVVLILKDWITEDSK